MPLGYYAISIACAAESYAIINKVVNLNHIETGETIQMNYQDFIEITPGKRSGKPCIKNTRISVYDVLGWLASGMTQQEIVEDFPEINQEQIQSCLAYAAEREHHLHTVNAA